VRAVSAYALFCADQKPRLRESNPSLTSIELVRLMAATWKKLEGEGKKEWIDRASGAVGEGGSDPSGTVKEAAKMTVGDNEVIINDMVALPSTLEPIVDSKDIDKTDKGNKKGKKEVMKQAVDEEDDEEDLFERSKAKSTKRKSNKQNHPPVKRSRYLSTSHTLSLLRIIVSH
jgi:hypothetical protein